MKYPCFKCVDKFIASPNHDERPTGAVIDTLVVHAISLPPDYFGNVFVEAFFTNQLNSTEHAYFEAIKHLKVSAHFYIKRSGFVIQFVDPDDRAWHAGESSFNGKASVNDFSIGIELEGCDSHPFEQVQYRQLAKLTTELMRRYPLITNERIVGHSDISPGRKTDPGPCFDWALYLSYLTQ